MRLDTLGLKNDMRKIDKMMYDKQSREKICDAAKLAIKRHVMQTAKGSIGLEIVKNTPRHTVYRIRK